MANVSSFDYQHPSSKPSIASDIKNTNDSILFEVTTIKKSVATISPDSLEDQTFSFPRRPRSGHRFPVTRDKYKYIFEGKLEDGCRRGMMLVKHEDISHLKEVKVKYGWNNKNKRELEGLSVISVNGEEVDLNFLARVADGAYEAELASMTEGMSRAHLIGLMESLEGEWCGRSERRKVVDAAEFVKALPIDWKIELALRQRAGLPSIHCRSYVSPSGKHFKTCKDAAIYLRNQSLTDIDGPYQEGQMREIKNDFQFHTLTNSADVELLASGELYDVKVASLIECSPCGVVFQDMRELEKHLATFHKEITRRFHLPTGPRVLEKYADMDDDDEPQPQQNGQRFSSSQKTPEPQEPVIERFKTKCTWCNKEFLYEPVDTETMEDASGFMCPPCKDKLCGVFERSLSKSYQS